MIKLNPLHKGFTLIELMVVVAIVGILAVVASSYYQDYVIRSRVAEMVTDAESAKSSISEYILTNNAYPPNGITAGVTTFTSKMVKTMTIGSNNGVITISSSTSVNGTANAIKIVLTPTLLGNTVSWKCTATGKTKYAPASCR